MALIFISYRRDDTGAFTHLLANTLSTSLGESKVFLDLDRIRLGDRWQERIETALEQATVLVPVIGPKWLLLQDQHGRRRLDKADDWVRNEIHSALRRKIPVLTVCVDGTCLPVAEALPDALLELPGRQNYSISNQYFTRDFPHFLAELRNYGFESHTPTDVLPAPLDKSPALTEQELVDVLATLPDWCKVDTRPRPDGTGVKIELFRHYVFASFDDAIHFMATASRYIDKTEHHPEWSNTWVNVKVWLTSFDIGFRPAHKDVRLANYLDTLFKEYQRGDDATKDRR